MKDTSIDVAGDSPPATGPDTKMHEIRLVGRGGQGVVTAGDLLGRAALAEGRHAQSIPTFGPERRGALSSSTLRISGVEILLKCSATSPDFLIVLDPTIWHHANILLGLGEGSGVVFNSPEAPEEIDRALRSGRHGYRPAAKDLGIFTVDATGIAIEILGRPITNTAMMGAFVGATGILGIESVERVLLDRFGTKGEGNVKAARAAMDRVRKLGG